LPDIKFKVLVGLLKSVMRPAYDEIVGVARLVRESDTDWTIVRVSMLNNQPGSGKIRAGYLGKKQMGQTSPAQIWRHSYSGRSRIQPTCGRRPRSAIDDRPNEDHHPGPRV
jgi:hypothetical protein